MKLLLSSILLASLCSLSSWSISAPAVSQSPDVSVMEGETVNISCCYMWMGGRVRITWFKNQTSIKETVMASEPRKQTNNCSTLTFSNITTKDLGRYICRFKVEIPTFATVEGSGTFINVTTREDKADKAPRDSASTPVHVIIVLAVMLPLLVLALTCFLSLPIGNQGHEARVIYEASHSQDSEEPETDKHKWERSLHCAECQVTVYDSIDYFQQVETKRSE